MLFTGHRLILYIDCSLSNLEGLSRKLHFQSVCCGYYYFSGVSYITSFEHLSLIFVVILTIPFYWTCWTCCYFEISLNSNLFTIRDIYNNLLYWKRKDWLITEEPYFNSKIEFHRTNIFHLVNFVTYRNIKNK